MSKFFILFFAFFTQIALSNPNLSISNADEKISQIGDSRDFYRDNRRAFRRDDHRYDRRYRNFDYDKHGYYNVDGLYYGYFDKKGYFFNNIYFKYNSKYRYIDRLHKRGYFSPHRHHYRRYIHHVNNDWNRVHQYREPNRIVYGYYYQEEYFPRDRDNRVEYGTRYDSREPLRYRDGIRRDDFHHRRDRFHRDRDHRRRDRIDRGYREDRDRYRDSHHNNYHNNHHRDEIREDRPRKSRSKIIYYRFGDKKGKKKDKNK